MFVSMCYAVREAVNIHFANAYCSIREAESHVYMESQGGYMVVYRSKDRKMVLRKSEVK